MISKETKPLGKQRLQDVLTKLDDSIREQTPLLEDLKNVGINVETVWDLVNNRPHPMLKNNFTGSYEIAYPILLRHLDCKYGPRIQEGIIRALTEKGAKTIATEKLLERFYKEENKNLKWALANALKTLMTWQQRKKHPEIANVWKGTTT